MRSFQYKILNNVPFICYPFLNKNLYAFGMNPSPLCSLFVLCDETTFYICYECDHVKRLWSGLVQYFPNILILPILIPQNVICGIVDSAYNDSVFKIKKVFINHMLLIINLKVYSKSREMKFMNINSLIS